MCLTVAVDVLSNDIKYEQGNFTQLKNSGKVGHDTEFHFIILSVPSIQIH